MAIGHDKAAAQTADPVIALFGKLRVNVEVHVARLGNGFLRNKRAQFTPELIGRFLRVDTAAASGGTGSRLIAEAKRNRRVGRHPSGRIPPDEIVDQSL